MASRISPYSLPSPIRSSLLKNAPETVPPTDDLEQLQSDLKLLKLKTLERAKKAGEDLKVIQESMRQMKEREKGKFKAIEKVKREREFTPLPDPEEQKLLQPLHSSSSKSRLNSLPLNSLPPSARSSLDPRRSAADEVKKKKKKRKRDDDSDGEQESQRPRKTTPIGHIPPPPKAQKTNSSNSQSHSKPQGGPDFSIPQTHPLEPQRPPIPVPPIPGPSKPTDVMEDFSKTKQPAQTPFSTFVSSIEPWIRNIREEDVGFLEYTGDEVEPFIMPKLGRHYLEVWEDQDAGLLPLVPLGEPQTAPSSSFAAPLPKWDPSTLHDLDLVIEGKGHGPLTERVISALLPIPDVAVWKGVKAAEDAMEGRPGGSGAAAARKERLNVTDLEARIRDTMRFHKLIDGMPDFSEKVDDPIATALRHAQRELRTVVATNKGRKERLAIIARDRLGYQEYIELRDSIDKNITTLYTKLQKKDLPKSSRKKKKLPGSAPPEGDLLLPQLPRCPAAFGLNTDDENHLSVDEQLKQLVETRRQWVDTVGVVFDEKQMENAGKIWGLPPESIYQGLDDEVQAMLLRPPLVEAPGTSRAAKGKERATGYEMDTS